MSEQINLTQKQKVVLDWIVWFIDTHGHSPSIQEIADGLKYGSLATVHKHLVALRWRGHITWKYGIARSLTVMGSDRAIFAWAYQIAGALDAPAWVLDNLSAAAQGLSLPHALAAFTPGEPAQ